MPQFESWILNKPARIWIAAKSRFSKKIMLKQ